MRIHPLVNTMTETLTKQIGELFANLRQIRDLLNDLNSKVDYIIEIYGINKTISENDDLADWEDFDK